MKLKTYSSISEIVEASLETIRSKEMVGGASNAEAAYFALGVTKSLLCEALLDVPANVQTHIFKVLERLGK